MADGRHLKSELATFSPWFCPEILRNFAQRYI